MITPATPPDFLKLLAHELRWQLLSALAHSDYRVQELAARVQRPMNLVSYHLRQLREAGLIEERRSSADGRDLYYTLKMAEFAHHFRASGAMLHPALASDKLPPSLTTPTRLLFLCTHNSARSQMAEGLLRAKAGSRPITVLSAGDHPSTIHPAAIAAMHEIGIDISAQRSKHFDTFRDEHFDYVVTVCDQVRENCPLFPGVLDAIHWSIPDPSLASGTSAEEDIFRSTRRQLSTRVEHLLLLVDHANISKNSEGLS